MFRTIKLPYDQFPLETGKQLIDARWFFEKTYNKLAHTNR